MVYYDLMGGVLAVILFVLILHSDYKASYGFDDSGWGFPSFPHL